MNALSYPHVYTSNVSSTALSTEEVGYLSDREVDYCTSTTHVHVYARQGSRLLDLDLDLDSEPKNPPAFHFVALFLSATARRYTRVTQSYFPPFYAAVECKCAIVNFMKFFLRNLFIGWKVLLTSNNFLRLFKRREFKFNETLWIRYIDKFFVKKYSEGSINAVIFKY